MKSRNVFQKNFNVKTALAFLVLSFISIIIFSYSIYNASLSIIENEDINHIEDSLEQSSANISAYLEKMKSFSNIIAMHPDIKKALEKSDKKALESISSLVGLAKDSDIRIRSITVVSKEGFAITGGASMTMPLSENMMEEEWYKNALYSDRMPVLASTGHGVFTMDKEDWIISVAREIKGDNNEHLGVVLIDVSYKFIEDYLSKLNLGSGGYSAIISKQGDIIYYPDISIFEDNERSGELVNFVKEESIQPHTEKTVKKYIEFKNKKLYKTEITNSQWILYGFSSQDNIKLLKHNLFRSISVYALFTLFVSIIIGIFLSYYLTVPLRKLTLAMTRADKTWEHIKVPKGASYEVNTLSDEYNNLIDRIKILTKNISQKEEARRIFEIKVLQSQINPHFLYNTLDTILWLAELGENERVAQVSSNLGKMLRVSLNTEQTFVRLGTELEHTRSYLEIQKARYEDMLNYNIEDSAQTGILDLYVPKLIIQPIVENAIYHGIRKVGTGMINIDYKNENGILVINVSDNGAGFVIKNQENIYEDKTKHSSTIKPKLGGIGLKNVSQRIKLLCGDEYGLDIKSEPGKGTKVTVRIKYMADLQEAEALK